MALPIGATPVLTGKEAAKFMDDLRKDAKKPGLVPTPKLEQAVKLIEEHAKQQSKHGC